MGCKPSKNEQSCNNCSNKSVPVEHQASDPGKKRRAAVSAQEISNSDMNNWKKPLHEKSNESKVLLQKIISSNQKLQVLFGHLDSSQIDDVIMAMFPRDVKVNERVIKQGESGDNFWIVESGKFDIFVNRARAAISENDPLGDKVASCESGACFGELALMYNAPRAATVIATQPGRVWGLDATSFKMMVVTAENSKKKKYESFLEKVPLLKELNQYERAALSDVIDVATFKPDERIMKQGDQGRFFYILESGDARAMISEDGKTEVEAKNYKVAGDYFGELALLSASPRKASVHAGPKGCVLLSISKEKFDRVLGPIKHRLNVENYPDYAEIIRAEKAKPDTAQEPTSPVSD